MNIKMASCGHYLNLTRDANRKPFGKMLRATHLSHLIHSNILWIYECKSTCNTSYLLLFLYVNIILKC